MELKLKRIALRDTYTIGNLYINGEYFCDTCEDKVRNLSEEAKVAENTAIPYGKYEVVMNVLSPKYSRKSSYIWCGGYLPRLLNVPHFDGILIHAGNTAADSTGCILVGENKVKGQVVNSMATLKKLMAKLPKNEKITITIE